MTCACGTWLLTLTEVQQGECDRCALVREWTDMFRVPAHLLEPTGEETERYLAQSAMDDVRRMTRRKRERG